MSGGLVIERAQQAQSDDAVPTDAELLGQVHGAGDHAALRSLYERYSGACMALALRVSRDRGIAEEAVQEAFVAAWRGSGYDPARGSVSTWLLTVTHHKAVDLLRKEARRQRDREHGVEALDVVSTAPGPADEAERLVRGAQVRTALRELSPEQREVVTLAYFGGHTQREIAALTGAPLGTVKTRTLAALRRLRRDLGEIGIGPEGVNEGE